MTGSSLTLPKKLKTLYFNILLLCVIVITSNGYVEARNPVRFPPLDLHDFKDLLLQSDVFVDKSLLIEKLIKTFGKAPIAINQPKSWGKSTNMDMLRRFFEIEVNDQGVELPADKKSNRKLFLGGKVRIGNRQKVLKKLKISQCNDTVAKYQGKFPVLYFSFKGIFDVDFNKTKALLTSKIIDLFTTKYPYLEKYCSLQPENPNGAELKQFFRKESNPNVNLNRAFYLLCFALREHFKRRVVVLIDDYDEPIQHALQKCDETSHKYINLVGMLLSSVLDGINIDVVERSYLTGTFPYNEFQLRLSRLEHYSFLDAEFSEYYGFTEHEVEELLKKIPAVQTKLEDIKAWYNGFDFDGQSLYHPISILECLKNDGKLQHYSVKNGTFLDFVGPKSFNLQFHRGLQRLCSNKTRYFFHLVSAGVPYPSDIYYFLLFGGYIRVKKYNSTLNDNDFNLAMPNFEAVYMYEKFILKLITDKFGFPEGWQKPLGSLLGDYKMDEFRTALQKVLLATSSLDRDKNLTHHPIANIETHASDGRFYNGLLFSIAYSLPPYFIQISDMGAEYFDKVELILIPSVTSGRNEAIIVKFREMWVVDKYLSTEEHSDSRVVFGKLQEDKSRRIDDLDVNLAQQAEFRVKSMEILRHYPVLRLYPYIQHIHKLYAVFRANEVAVAHRKVPNERSSFTPRFRPTRTTRQRLHRR